MKPAMQMVKIQQQHIICASPPTPNRMVDDPDWTWDEEGGQ